MKKSVKFCKDCNYCELGYDPNFPICTHPNLYNVSLVTGELEHNNDISRVCACLREYGFIASIVMRKEVCGKSGRWFKAKEIK